MTIGKVVIADILIKTAASTADLKKLIDWVADSSVVRKSSFGDTLIMGNWLDFVAVPDLQASANSLVLPEALDSVTGDLTLFLHSPDVLKPLAIPRPSAFGQLARGSRVDRVNHLHWKLQGGYFGNTRVIPLVDEFETFQAALTRNGLDQYDPVAFHLH